MKMKKTRLMNRLEEKAHYYNIKTGGPQEAITKELLHYDILQTLSSMGVFQDGVTFQGGTALRLCYGGRRYSEDLDFATGHDFNFDRLNDLSTRLTDYLSTSYGLECTVTPPKHDIDQEKGGVQVAAWKLSVSMDPARKDIPKQRIWIEFANVRALTKELRPFISNFEQEAGQHMLIAVETPQEIFADKILAAANRPRVKARDIFDLKFLSDRNITLDPAHVIEKLKDYKVTDHDAFLDRLDKYRLDLTGEAFRASWLDEMTRFTNPDLRQVLLSNEFYDSMAAQLDRVLGQASDDIKAALGMEPDEPKLTNKFRL
ncbi:MULTISPECIES: nucleotidyl transferase AbiEii/AbiGii toxin family protein [Aeromonas]|uniref:nucleotidyl transferase AbiEii/AbiGii toxin family protein n=1 Tax=Aeromonas TaxID=642 RepID=UPI0018F1ED64|nr:nucleotidyl transferase AbiEii/AbiGii toxin family protein [Aeromonas veronii]MBJ7591493.1 nucleotidyl transferase AbiEii/AbiGii toxin family protein [Aeromonas veronii]